MVAKASEQLIANRLPSEYQSRIEYDPAQRGAPDHAAPPSSSSHDWIDDCGDEGMLNDLKQPVECVLALGEIVSTSKLLPAASVKRENHILANLYKRAGWSTAISKVFI